MDEVLKQGFIPFFFSVFPLISPVLMKSTPETLFNAVLTFIEGFNNFEAQIMWVLVWKCTCGVAHVECLLSRFPGLFQYPDPILVADLFHFLGVNPASLTVRQVWDSHSHHQVQKGSLCRQNLIQMQYDRHRSSWQYT